MARKIAGGPAIPVFIVTTEEDIQGGAAIPVVSCNGTNTDLTVTNDLIVGNDASIGGNLTIDGYLIFLEQSGAPTAITDYGQLWTQSDNILYFQDGDGENHVVHGYPTFKSYAVTTQGLGGSPDVYAAGFYDAPAADANLDQASTTVTLGTASASYAAHAFVVAGGAGVTDGSDLVLTVTGTSITDAGVRTPADSEVVASNLTGAALNQYLETSKKWLGQVTYTLSSTGGTAFSFDFNYGWAKYEDWGNRDFTVTDLEVVGLAGANDANVDIQLLLHDGTGWTYSAAAFDPGGTVIASLVDDHSTDDQFVSGDPFAWKRANLSQAIQGSNSGGLVLKFITTANNAIEFADAHIGVEF